MTELISGFDKKTECECLLSVLEQHYLFSRLGCDSLQNIIRISEVIDLNRGVFPTEYMDKSSFFFIIEGMVKCNGTSYFRSGEILLDSSILREYDEKTEFRVVRDSSLLKIDRKPFLDILGKEESEVIMSAFLAKLEELSADFHIPFSMEYDFFLFIKENYGLSGSLIIDSSKREISDILGLDISDFTGMVNRLINMGVIVWEGNSMTLNLDYVLEKTKIEP